MSETIYVIDSDRPATNGRSVKGQKGRGYRMSDAPGQVYVVGTDWYWRGPESETHSYLPPATKSPAASIASSPYISVPVSLPKYWVDSSQTYSLGKFTMSSGYTYEVVYNSISDELDIHTKKNDK